MRSEQSDILAPKARVGPEGARAQRAARDRVDVSGFVLDFLGAHAVPGLERYHGGVFTRVVRAAHGPALLTLGPDGVDVASADPRDVADVAALGRRMLDLDTNVTAADAVLSRDPVLARLVAARPGLRAPGCADAFETAVRTVVGQQISVRGARTVLGRIVAELGEPAGDWTLFPTPGALAAADPVSLPMPRARGRSIVALATAVRDGLDVATAPHAALLALPGIGPWTADYLRMRVRGDTDVLLAGDLVVRRAADDLGVDLSDGRADWAPWRTYATYHLWAHLVADSWAAARTDV